MHERDFHLLDTNLYSLKFQLCFRHVFFIVKFEYIEQKKLNYKMTRTE
jgi:hypothetical protein